MHTIRKRGRSAAVGPALLLGSLLIAACGGTGASADSGGVPDPGGAGGGGASGTAGAGGGQGGGASGGVAGGETGGFDPGGGASGSGAAGKPVQNTCTSVCGTVELCDDAHLGFDDDCNGKVDEGCPCTPGQQHWCFPGDPSKHGDAGCTDGVEVCQADGTWGECTFGTTIKSANPSCFGAATCTNLDVVPFATVALPKATQGFGADADPGSATYVVKCPPGVQTCPSVDTSTGTPTFQPLQSGEYPVTFTKTVAGVPHECKFSIFARAPGLRVELTWDNVGVESANPGGAKGPDLDLHVHRPNTTTPWLGADDCSVDNCRIDQFADGTGPTWFTDTADPHNWSKYADPSQNTCYFAPHGVGGQWKALGKGCHNPRLDLDTFACEKGVADPQDGNFCSPENVNFDEVPDKSWVRVAVAYFGTCTKTLPTHPTVTIHCDGSPVASLGPVGFDKPVTFEVADCGKKMWLAADVYVTKGECGIDCKVVPLHKDAAKAPVILDKQVVAKSFGPAYPK